MKMSADYLQLAMKKLTNFTQSDNLQKSQLIHN